MRLFLSFKEGGRALTVHTRFRCFARVSLEKRLDPKSVKRQAKADGAQDAQSLVPQPSSIS
jgi:hypothetical protein